MRKSMLRNSNRQGSVISTRVGERILLTQLDSIAFSTGKRRSPSRGVERGHRDVYSREAAEPCINGLSPPGQDPQRWRSLSRWMECGDSCLVDRWKTCADSRSTYRLHRLATQDKALEQSLEKPREPDQQIDGNCE